MQGNTKLLNRGFTLVEALISMIIMAAGLIAIAQFHAISLSGSANAKARTQATMLAREKIDNLGSSLNLARFDALAGDSDSPGEVHTGAKFNESFSRSWRVTNDDIDSDSNMDQKRIEVTVSWTDRLGAFNSVSLESIVHRVDALWAGRALIASGAGRTPPPTLSP